MSPEVEATIAEARQRAVDPPLSLPMPFPLAALVEPSESVAGALRAVGLSRNAATTRRWQPRLACAVANILEFGAETFHRGAEALRAPPTK